MLVLSVEDFRWVSFFFLSSPQPGAIRRLVNLVCSSLSLPCSSFHFVPSLPVSFCNASPFCNESTLSSSSSLFCFLSNQLFSVIVVVNVLPLLFFILPICVSFKLAPCFPWTVSFGRERGVLFDLGLTAVVFSRQRGTRQLHPGPSFGALIARKGSSDARFRLLKALLCPVELCRFPAVLAPGMAFNNRFGKMRYDYHGDPQAGQLVATEGTRVTVLEIVDGNWFGGKKKKEK